MSDAIFYSYRILASIEIQKRISYAIQKLLLFELVIVWPDHNVSFEFQSIRNAQSLTLQYIDY